MAKPNYDPSQEVPMAPADNEGKRLNMDSSVPDFVLLQQPSPGSKGMVNDTKGVDTPAREPRGLNAA
jgi:hypothetical protein